MQIPQPRILASTLGAVVVLSFALVVESRALPPQAQAPAGGNVIGGSVGGPLPAGRGGAAPRGPQGGAAGGLVPWTAIHTPPQSVLPTQGMWGEVIASTSRWIVIQNQEGQQFPLAADRIRQFLIRWPSSVNDLSPASMVEATGVQTSTNSMMTDHIDVYEADAQNLVSPTIQSVAGANGGPVQVNTSNFSFIDFETLNFGARNWTELPGSGTTNWTELPSIVQGGSLLLHVVGRSTGINPVQLSGFGPGTMSVTPGPSGAMTVTQVTLGTNSYAKKGDLVHLTADSASARGLDVSQLVLYKKIPLRRFQP